MTHLPPLQSIYGAVTYRSTFLDNLVSSVSQPNSSSLQTPKHSSVSTIITHSSASITNEIRSTNSSVSSVASTGNTIPGRSLKVLNNTEGKSFLSYLLHYINNIHLKNPRGIYEFNL